MNHLPENFLEHALSIDDTFQFHCNQCGECCKHREDILISPFDLFRLTRYLNMKPTEFVTAIARRTSAKTAVCLW